MYVRVRKLDLQSHPIWGRYFVFELEVGHAATSSSLSTVITSFWLWMNDFTVYTKQKVESCGCFTRRYILCVLSHLGLYFTLQQGWVKNAKKTFYLPSPFCSWTSEEDTIPSSGMRISLFHKLYHTARVKPIPKGKLTMYKYVSGSKRDINQACGQDDRVLAMVLSLCFYVTGKKSRSITTQERLGKPLCSHRSWKSWASLVKTGWWNFPYQ